MSNPPGDWAPVPTVGRRVWYWPTKHERATEHDQPFDAGICHVNKDGTVNLDVKNENGFQLRGKQHIVLAATPEKAAPGQASWMPYQTAQAQAASNG